MSTELYTILALAARYLFCALMILIVFRAWRVTVVDNRRARLLRNRMPDTGCIGEFVINPGKTKRQHTLPVPREGVLGSARGADVCVRHKDMRRYHASLEQREGGLLVTPIGRAKALLNDGVAGETLYMRDGDTLRIGSLTLLLVLFEPEPKPDDSRDLFMDDDLLWDAQPCARKATKSPRAQSKGHPGKPREKTPRDAQADELKSFEDDLWPDE